MPDLPLTDWVRAIMTTLGYPGIAFLLVLETMFPPIPSEVVLPLSGYLASEGEFRLPLLIATATAGSLAGALVLYAVGRKVTFDRLEHWFADYGRYALTGPEDLERAESWFERHSRWAVLFGRLVPGVRSMISIPAGLSKMPVVEFCILTAIGSGLWNTLLIGAGWLLGSQWNQASEYANFFQYTVILAGLAAIAWFVGRRVLQRRKGA